MKITTADDTLKLLLFLQEYPNQWHTYSKDWLTVATLNKCKEYYNIEINECDQMRLNTVIKKKSA